MTRRLRFPEEAVGQVQLVADGAQPELLPAQGPIDVAADRRAVVALQASARADLSFLDGIDDDLLVGLEAKSVDADGLHRLARQTAVKTLRLGTVDDAALAGLVGLGALEQFEVTLSEPGDSGLASLAGCPLRVLWLHGDPGTALGNLARSATITRLHIHVERLDLEALRALATSTHLEHLDVEVGQVLDTDDLDVLDALAAVASGLSSLSVKRADGGSGLSALAQLATLRGFGELTLNGGTYTPAAVARLERKLVRA